MIFSTQATKKIKLISSLLLFTSRTFNSSISIPLKNPLRMETIVKTAARVALCQVKVTADKLSNIQHVENIIRSAIQSSPTPVDLLVLPEIWNSPYSSASFPVYAEIIPSVISTVVFDSSVSSSIIDPELSPSIAKLIELAKSLNIWIIGGSIPEYIEETDSTKRSLYNTCVIIDSNGNIIGKHRKMHLFDIDIPGKMTFKESDSLTAGNNVTVVDTPWGKVGVGICYDIRFPEYAMLMRQKGCKLLVYPGAFNMVTGPAHWELLQRARAVDNQLYVLACSPARDTTAGYVAWGHSSVVSPWGDVISQAGHEEEIIYADLDFNKVDEIRQNIPCLKQKRHDIYALSETHDTTVEKK